MSRYISEQDYVRQLDAGFKAASHLVRHAPDWDETQRRMQHGTMAFLTAIRQVGEGRPRKEIDQKLSGELAKLGPAYLESLATFCQWRTDASR